jgi:hypothetical protein
VSRPLVEGGNSSLYDVYSYYMLGGRRFDFESDRILFLFLIDRLFEIYLYVIYTFICHLKSADFSIPFDLLLNES